MLLHSDLLIKTANQRILFLNNEMRKGGLSPEQLLAMEAAKQETITWKKTFEGLAEEGKMPIKREEVKVLKLR